MKNPWKIFYFVILLISISHTGFAQTSVLQIDSAKLSQKKAESSVSSKDMDKKDDADKQQGNNQKSSGDQAIKQVKGARPDMSKARGARPAYIERQSGSGIPKGIGRPGGAIKPGKR